MSEAIAFLIGFFAMVFLWGDVDYFSHDSAYRRGYRKAIEDTTIQPERKKGEWIDHTEDGYVECPFCHSGTNCDGNKDELHFCFSCGARMKGEQDGH